MTLLKGHLTEVCDLTCTSTEVNAVYMSPLCCSKPQYNNREYCLNEYDVKDQSTHT